MKTIKKGSSLVKIALVLLAVSIFLPYCNKVANESRSATMLVVEKITGINWEDEESDVLFSDVIVETEQGTTIQSDLGVAYFRAVPYSPLVEEPSDYYDILVKQYRVRYIRSDGRNKEGVDVPYSFTGSMNVLVPVGETVSASFVVVRAQAKTEPPLVELRYTAGDKELEVDAHIDFYGEDLAGHAVYANGKLHIVFANFANE